MPPLAKRLLLALAALLVGAAGAEIGFRLVAPRVGVDPARLAAFRRWAVSNGARGEFTPHPYLLYRQTVEPGVVNSLGFLDREFELPRHAGVLRIACVGSSTTEGGNSERHEGSYPFFLERILAERLGRPVEVYNFGISGWNSTEEMLNYFLAVQDYAPDLVLIHEAANDSEPRDWPGFRADYSHYRKPWTPPGYSAAERLLFRASNLWCWFRMRRSEGFLADAVVRPPAGPLTWKDGAFPAGTDLPFRRNIRSIAEHVALRGGVPVLVTLPFEPERAKSEPMFRTGIEDGNRILRELAAANGWPLVDLDADARAQPAVLAPYFLDLVHVAPEGNRWKAERIATGILDLARRAGGASGPAALPATADAAPPQGTSRRSTSARASTSATTR